MILKFLVRYSKKYILNNHGQNYLFVIILELIAFFCFSERKIEVRPTH